MIHVFWNQALGYGQLAPEERGWALFKMWLSLSEALLWCESRCSVSNKGGARVTGDGQLCELV